MTDHRSPCPTTELHGAPSPLRLCLASYLLGEARRLLTVVVAEAEADRTPRSPLGALVEMDTIAGELACAEARLHRLLGPSSP